MKLLLFALPALSGCGLLLGETTRTIHLVSEPPGAEVAMDGLRVGKTPVDVEVLDHEDYEFSYRWEGGATAECRLSPSWQPLFLLGDVVLGGIAGIVIDTELGWWFRQSADRCAGRASQGGVP